MRIGTTIGFAECACTCAGSVQIEKVESLQRELDSRISAEKEHQEEKNLLEFKNQLLLDMVRTSSGLECAKEWLDY